MKQVWILRQGSSHQAVSLPMGECPIKPTKRSQMEVACLTSGSTHGPRLERQITLVDFAITSKLPPG